MSHWQNTNIRTYCAHPCAGATPLRALTCASNLCIKLLVFSNVQEAIRYATQCPIGPLHARQISPKQRRTRFVKRTNSFEISFFFNFHFFRTCFKLIGSVDNFLAKQQKVQSDMQCAKPKCTRSFSEGMLEMRCLITCNAVRCTAPRASGRP